MQVADGAVPEQKAGRVVLLDEVRGLCILLMILYHGAYDIVYLFGMDIPLFHHWLLDFAQPAVAGVFVFISGIACRYSRSNQKRGLQALALGLLMTAVTLIMMPSQAIFFGILHCLGCCMLLFALLRHTLDKLSPPFGIAVCTLLFLLTQPVEKMYIGIAGWELVSLPNALYQTNFLFPLGFLNEGFFSADYFPLLPWAFVFFAGAYAGMYSLHGRMPAFFYRGHVPFLAATGRHTLLIYVLHQPVLYGVFWLLAKLLPAA